MPATEVPTRYFNPAHNPYPAKKLWPPNMLEMDTKHQFRLERRYRRRAQLAYLKPGWVRGVKFAQFSAILGVVAYSVLWMDWGEGMREPFRKVREWVGLGDVRTAIDVQGGFRKIEGTLGGRVDAAGERIEGKGKS